MSIIGLPDEMDPRRRRRLRALRLSTPSGLVTNSSVAQLVGQAPVDLLGHRVVEAAQAGLDVGDRDPELGRDERRGERRVHVAIDDDERRLERPGSTGSRATIRAAVWPAWVPGADAQIDVGLRQPRSRKKTSDMAGVVVLAGVDEPLRRRPARPGAAAPARPS